MGTDKGWLKSKFAVYMDAHEKRIRDHRERISKEMQSKGISEGDALKQCCVPGCYQETVETWKNELRKWGWVQVDGNWYCPLHSNQQKKAC